MLFRPTSVFVGFDIAFINSKTTLEISSRTNILFQAILTGYHINNVIIITKKDPLIKYLLLVTLHLKQLEHIR